MSEQASCSKCGRPVTVADGRGDDFQGRRDESQEEENFNRFSCGCPVDSGCDGYHAIWPKRRAGR
jgi:hypothetical protein